MKPVTRTAGRATSAVRRLAAAARAEAGKPIDDLEAICSDADQLSELAFAAVEMPGMNVVERVLRATALLGANAALDELKILPSGGAGTFMVSGIQPVRQTVSRRLPRWERAGEFARLLAVGLLLILLFEGALATVPWADQLRRSQGASAPAAEAAFDDLVAQLGGGRSEDRQVSETRGQLMSPGGLNTLLLFLQGNWGEPVARASDWGTMGFVPAAGAKPLWVVTRLTDGDDVVGIGRTAVWAASRVIRRDVHADVGATTARLLHWGTREGIKLTWVCPKERGATGDYFWPVRVMHICRSLTGRERLLVLTHELAHHLQGKHDRFNGQQALTEDEADAVTVVALGIVGIPDVSIRELGYLSRPGDHLTGIRAARSAIIAMGEELAEAAGAGEGSHA